MTLKRWFIRIRKKWAVGEDAEWETYFERGIGKSNINLIKQFHSGGKEDFNDSFLGFLTPDHLNYDYKNAFQKNHQIQVI